MRFQTTALLAFATAASAQHTYNITQAYTPGNFGMYNCLTFAKVNAWLPSCLDSCHTKANAADGCAFEDYTCHCVNNQVYSDAIESCAFPPSLGGNGTCTLQDLGMARPVVNGMCNFLNATLYASYQGCNATLSKAKTYGILAEEESVAVGWPFQTVGNVTYGTRGYVKV